MHTNGVDVHVMIPARLHSTRLPGKLLKDLHGQSILERVYRQAQKAQPTSIHIATDDASIADAAHDFGAKVIMTSPTHPSGTARCAEAALQLMIPAEDIIVNVQGDEPFIDPLLIRQVASSLANAQAPMATLCWPIHDEAEWLNPHVVKVVRDARLHALYFSRSPIPAHRDGCQPLKSAFRHIGLYAYRADFLQKMIHFPPCELETVEALEQLNVLYAGYAILVEQACVAPCQDINTEADLVKAREMFTS